MIDNELLRLLRAAHRLEVEEAEAFLAEPGHLEMHRLRAIAYDDEAASLEERAHLEALCRYGRCPRLRDRIRNAIEHPSSQALAAWAESALGPEQEENVRLHVEVDRCRSCLLRLERSAEVGAHRALMRAGEAVGTQDPEPHALAASTHVPVGLTASGRSRIEVEVADEERGLSAKLWESVEGVLEVMGRADDALWAGVRLSTEVIGPVGAWAGAVVLDEQDDYGWLGRATVGRTEEELPRLLGDSGEGLVLTVSLPDQPPVEPASDETSSISGGTRPPARFRLRPVGRETLRDVLAAANRKGLYERWYPSPLAKVRALVSAVEGSLELRARVDDPGADGALLIVEWDTDEQTHRLFVPLVWGPTEGACVGDVHLGSAPDQFALRLAEAPMPFGSLPAEDPEVVRASVLAATSARTLRAWRSLREHRQVGEAVRSAIGDAFKILGVQD